MSKMDYYRSVAKQAFVVVVVICAITGRIILLRRIDGIYMIWNLSLKIDNKTHNRKNKILQYKLKVEEEEVGPKFNYYIKNIYLYIRNFLNELREEKVFSVGVGCRLRLLQKKIFFFAFSCC